MEKSFENYRTTSFKVTFLLDLTVGELSQVLHKTCQAKPNSSLEDLSICNFPSLGKGTWNFRHVACQCGKHTVNEHFKDN